METEQLEKLETLIKALNIAKANIADVEIMIEDYKQCKSSTSQKYLEAAIKRQASTISVCTAEVQRSPTAE